ncbi:MAG: hypothetical protein COB85_01330 [Bacteroidetes bacterium]|nr:MAG: hypothetical protein COB85_01330 [Bacteroidota bacterium]
MLGYRVSNIENIPTKRVTKFFAEGAYIILLYSNRIPPHLSFMFNGLVYSLSVSGPKVGLKFEELQRLTVKKNIECLYFKLTEPDFGGNSKAIHNLLKIVTTRYKTVDPLIATCLYPIRDFSIKAYGVDVTNVRFIFDLLPILYKHNLILGCFQQNMDDIVYAGDFTLRNYTMSDIENCINQYKEAIEQ